MDYVKYEKNCFAKFQTEQNLNFIIFASFKRKQKCFLFQTLEIVHKKNSSLILFQIFLNTGFSPKSCEKINQIQLLKIRI